MPPAACSLRLLGPPELRCGAAVLLLEPQRPHQLLAYMAARGDWVRREQLAALFWPDRGETAARSNLRKVILLAHQALQTVAHGGAAAALPAIEDHGGALRWRVATDAASFLQALERGQFAEAIALYGGPLMRGLDGPRSTPFAEWLQFERSRFAERWRDCVLNATRQASDPTQRIELTARMLARDPLDEVAVRLHLTALVEAGRHGDAQNAYRAYASSLVQETGLEPGAQIKALCDVPEPAGPAAARAEGAAFYGRADELRTIHSAARSDTAAVLVIVGPGGVGKSRLLTEAMRQIGPGMRDGAFVIALHPVPDTQALVPRIARTLGVELAGSSDALATLCGHLRTRSLLLGLDNFEHLVAAAPLIEQLQASCPSLRIVVTSRVRPGIAGEQVLVVGGLAYPSADDDDVEAFDAVRLFAHHARRALPAFDLAAEAADVATICRLVDGLPLALELAASWVRLFRCADVAADLRRSLELLRAADGDAASSVAAILEQSWSLLVPQERQLLSLLAVFHGSFDADAVRAVAGMSLIVVAALVDKSLVRTEAQGRMSLHPLVRHFAEQRLREGDAGCTAAQAHQRHADHYSRVLAALAPSQTEPERHLHAVGLDLDNFLAAWNFGVAMHQADTLERCLAALGHYFVQRGPYGLAIDLFSAGEQVLQHADPPRPVACALLLRRRGSLHYRNGDLAHAEADSRQALALARAAGDGFEQRSALNLFGILAWARGDQHAAQAAFEEALASLEPGKDVALEANLVGNLGLIAQAEGRYDMAHQRYAAALALHRRVGSQIGIAQQLMNLGTVCWALRQWREVVRLMGEGLALARSIGYAKDRPYGLRVMAQAHAALGELSAARSCCHSALALIDEGAETLQRPIALAVLCEIELAEGRLDAAASTLREAALAACQGALAHDQVSVLNVWASLLLAQHRLSEAAILWSLLATHAATLADERPVIEAALQRLRAQLPPQIFAACQHKASTLELEPLLTQAASLLAPTL